MSDFFNAWRHCGELQDKLEKTVTHVSPQIFEDIETDMEAMRDGYEMLQNELVGKNKRIAELEAKIDQIYLMADMGESLKDLEFFGQIKTALKKAGGNE